jgi:glycerate kinase
MGIGGSATNDGGVGMAQALGVSFPDASGKEISFGGGALSDMQKIDLSGLDKRIAECEIVIACDVTNPLCGPTGASAVYGPQKARRAKW